MGGGVEAVLVRAIEGPAPSVERHALGQLVGGEAVVNPVPDGEVLKEKDLARDRMKIGRIGREMEMC